MYTSTRTFLKIEIELRIYIFKFELMAVTLQISTDLYPQKIVEVGFSILYCKNTNKNELLIVVFTYKINK